MTVQAALLVQEQARVAEERAELEAAVSVCVCVCVCALLVFLPTR